MSDKFFLDTNIFVYSLDTTAPAKAAIAERLIHTALQTQNGVVSYQVVQEFFNVALRRFTPPMNHGDAAEYLSTVFRPLLRVHSSTGIFADAFTLQSTAGFSWYDSILVASAMQAGCTQLFTEDLQHGQRFGSLRIVNPFLWPE